MYLKMKSSGQQRVKLSEQILNNLLKRISNGRVSELASDMGLPYGLAYNLVPRLISSVRNFGNLTLETEDAFRQPWLKVLCS